MPIKLNLASGKEYFEGFINIDNGSMFPDSKLDININIFDLDYAENSISHIRLSHFVMYTRPHELKSLLQKFHSWLEIGGKMEIETADIKKICEAVNDADLEKSYSHGLINLFGTETTSPHRWGWSPDTLMFVLYDAGFRECVLGRGEKKPERDFKVIAIK